MSRVDTAVGLFRGEHACSQAVFAAWAPELGLDPGQAARIAAGFAGGMRLGGVCGAVTGAYMVLGLALCGPECVARAGRARIATAVTEFARRFRERCGSLDCPDIIGCDLRTAEGARLAREQDLFTVKCGPVVRAAAELLEEMLSDTHVHGREAMGEAPAEFKGVTAAAKANVFFDGKVVSHTIILADGTRKTLGVIFPGRYHFGTRQAERMEITRGECEVKIDGAPGVKLHTAGGLFQVPAESGFDIEVKSGLCEYVCTFLE